MTPYMRQVTNHLQSGCTRLGLEWSTVPELKLLRRQALTYRKLQEVICSDERLYQWAKKRLPVIERTIARKCEALGLNYYLQPDCRGAALYVSREPIPEDYYHSAAFCLDAV